MKHIHLVWLLVLVYYQSVIVLICNVVNEIYWENLLAIDTNVKCANNPLTTTALGTKLWTFRRVYSIHHPLVYYNLKCTILHNIIQSWFMFPRGKRAPHDHFLPNTLLGSPEQNSLLYFWHFYKILSYWIDL